MPMSHQAAAVLGGCPDCGAEMTTAGVLIEYEAGDGEAMVWAECPNCTEVVHPI